MEHEQKRHEKHEEERTQKQAEERKSEQRFSLPGPTIRPLWFPRLGLRARLDRTFYLVAGLSISRLLCTESHGGPSDTPTRFRA
jgi:hypothetical protein